MPDIIHLLPDSVANQIAAGEVVQRPASLIKELVENSIDAGATKVQVVVADAGKTLVQVIDNGKGMSETDARLSFERHATSKISRADDLFTLTTMGFRGEALASIAAVAQVELRTRRAEDELGVCLQIEGSKVINQEPVVCPVGANFCIKNLFFNVPARRKFLKSNHTELSNIIAEFERIVLAHPELSFTLSTPDAVLLDLPVGNFHQRIVNVFGRKIDKQLIPVQVETELVTIVGFVGNVESCRKKGAQQFFFVNGRFMRHPYFAKALQTAYERLIPEGEQIPFFLQIWVDPSRIDVNIHPTKTEIKFEDEQPIWQILRAAVREALGRFNAIPTIDFNTEDRPEIPVFIDGQRNNEVPMPSIEYDESYNPFFSEKEQEKKRKQSNSLRCSRAMSLISQDQGEMFAEAFSADPSSSFAKKETKSLDSFHTKLWKENTLYDHLEGTEQQRWKLGGHHLLQYKGRFILVPSEDGLLVVEQHRAHQCILFEEYVKQISAHRHQSQGLLFPKIIDVAPDQHAVLRAIEPDLAAAGFEISFLGGNSYSILGVPSGVDGIEPVTLLQSILDDAAHKTGEVHEEIVHTLALSLARKSALPVGQELSQDEMSDLLTRLFALSTPALTPDGKQVLHLIPHLSFSKYFD